MDSNYSQNNTLDCKEEYWSGIIDKITSTFKDWTKISKWMKIWEDAYHMLIWSFTDKTSSKAEDDAVREWLIGMWLKQDTVSKMMDGLKANNCWYDMLCQAWNIKDRIIWNITGLGQKFTKMWDDVVGNAKSTSSFKDRSAKINSKQIIQQELIIDKENLRRIMQMQDDTLSSNIDMLVDMHVSLNKINDQMVKKSMKATRDLCNSQATWAQWSSCEFK